MSIAKCPICGKAPKFWMAPDRAGCCKHFAMGDDREETIRLWSEYAAAMELMVATAVYFTVATDAGYKRLQEAGERALEVCK